MQRGLALRQWGSPTWRVGDEPQLTLLLQEPEIQQREFWREALQAGTLVLIAVLLDQEEEGAKCVLQLMF